MLLRLQLMELIKECVTTGEDPSKALEFATQNLAPRAPANKEFLNDLETAMVFLALPPDHPEVLALDMPKLRQEVAKRVTHTMLESDSMAYESDLRKLIRTRAYLGEKVVEMHREDETSIEAPFPPFDLRMSEDDDEQKDEQMNLS